MALIYKVDLYAQLKMYLHIKNELSRSRLSKVKALQTDATERITTPHLLVVCRLVSCSRWQGKEVELIGVEANLSITATVVLFRPLCYTELLSSSGRGQRGP